MKLAENLEIDEQMKHSKMKLQDERDRSKEYFGNKKEGQNDKCDITGVRPHVKLAENLEIAEQPMHKTLKPEDDRNRKKEYLDNKMESQNDSYGIASSTKLAEHVNSDGGMKDVQINFVRLTEYLEITERLRYNTLKPEDTKYRSKEYFDNKKKGQNDKYDITSPTNDPPCTKPGDQIDSDNGAKARLTGK